MQFANVKGNDEQKSSLFFVNFLFRWSMTFNYKIFLMMVNLDEDSDSVEEVSAWDETNRARPT